jgi:hypothetical protein
LVRSVPNPAGTRKILLLGRASRKVQQLLLARVQVGAIAQSNHAGSAVLGDLAASLQALREELAGGPWGRSMARGRRSTLHGGTRREKQL